MMAIPKQASKKALFLMPQGRSNAGCGKILLGQDLKQMSPGRVLFEVVVVGQDFQLVLECHLQRSVAARLKNRNRVEGELERVEQSGDGASVASGAKQAGQQGHFRKSLQYQVVMKNRRATSPPLVK